MSEFSYCVYELICPETNMVRYVVNGRPKTTNGYTFKRESE